jgi:hypothetical protein
LDSCGSFWSFWSIASTVVVVAVVAVVGRLTSSMSWQKVVADGRLLSMCSSHAIPPTLLAHVTTRVVFLTCHVPQRPAFSSSQRSSFSSYPSSYNSLSSIQNQTYQVQILITSKVSVSLPFQ